jgi:Protein of unknown function (DUF2934)
MATSQHSDAELSRTPSPRKRASRPAASKAAAEPSASRVVEGKLSPPPPNAHARQKMIAEAAYYRAEERAFWPGCELVDWLAAEAEVDARSCEG